MLSFAKTYLSFNLLFLLCIAGLAASSPITYNHHHRHHLNSRSFPYGKLADKLLNVNDVSYYMTDDLHQDDMVRVYPENHHSTPFSSILPISSFELPISIKTISTKILVSLASSYRIPDIIKKVVCSGTGRCSGLVAHDDERIVVTDY